MTSKGKSWRRTNPRDILKRLIAENPKAGKRRLLALFLEDVRSGDGSLDSLAEYWFAANYEKYRGDQT